MRQTPKKQQPHNVADFAAWKAQARPKKSPLEQVSEPPGLRQMRELFAAGAKTVAVEVCGDSLKEAGIFDGDTASVEQADSAREGQLILAMTPLGFQVKFYHTLPDGAVRLRGASDDHADSIFWREDVKIQGIVTRIIRVFDPPREGRRDE